MLRRRKGIEPRKSYSVKLSEAEVILLEKAVKKSRSTLAGYLASAAIERAKADISRKRTSNGTEPLIQSITI